MYVSVKRSVVAVEHRTDQIFVEDIERGSENSRLQGPEIAGKLKRRTVFQV